MTGLSPAAVLVVVALAAYRATRIITTDTITETFRLRVYAWAWIDGPDPMPRAGAWRTYVYELLSCQFCMGVWVSAATVGVWQVGWSWLRWMVVILAVAGGQAFIASRRDA